MATTNKTFSVKNGIDLANTIVLDSSKNLSNIASANVTSLNVSANISNVGNLLVTQNTFTGNLKVTTLANIATLNVTTAANASGFQFLSNLVASNTSNLSIVKTGSDVTIDTNFSYPSTIIVTNSFVATVNQTIFNLTANAPTAAYVFVSRNGVEQVPITDYTITSNNILTLTSNCIVNEVVEARIFTALTVINQSNYGVDTYANGTLVLANANLNFNNTATVNVAAIANGTTGANIAFVVNVSSSDWASSANGVAQSAYTRANSFSIFANVGSVMSNVINIAFMNTATVNVVASANGSNGANVVVTTNANAITGLITTANASNIALVYSGSGVTIDTRNPPGVGGVGSVNVYSNSGSVFTTVPNLTFNNSSSVNALVVANGTNSANISYVVNTSMNLLSLNVSSNISNVGNLFVTQNTFTGNLSVTTLANITSLNVSANIANVGNLLITQNTFTGNLSVTNLANIFTANISSSGIYANGSGVISGLANVNFNNTATVNVALTANGAWQSNVAFSTNANAITGLITSANTSNIALVYSGSGVTIDTRNPPGGAVNVWSNAASVVTTVSNLTFNNTATTNAVISANGSGANIAFVVNVSSSDWASGANSSAQTTFGTINTTFGTLNTNITTASSQVSSYANGTIILGSANLNFNNTASINVSGTANGTGQANIAFVINTSMNLVSLNVSANISNVGNLLVTQNTFTGNLSVTTLANITSLNVSANISNVGNLLVTQNTFTGNIAVGNVGFNSSAAILGSYYLRGSQNANTYGGVIIQNRYALGANASADFVAITDDGNDGVFFIDMGINNSGANDAAYPYLNKRDGYLITAGNTINTSNLTIGTTSQNSNVNFIVGGGANSNVVMTLNPGPINSNGGNVYVTGNISLTSGGTSQDLVTPMGVMCAAVLRLLPYMGYSVF